MEWRSLKTNCRRTKKAGFRIISDGIKVVWTPTEEMLEECKKFGEEFVKYCELNVK